MTDLTIQDRSPIALLEEGRRYLAEAVSADDALKVRAVASAAQVYARQAHLGREAENMAAELRIRAERRAGELLREAAEAGERAQRGTPNSRLDVPAPTLDDIGVTPMESSRFQAVASVPESDFEEYLQSTKDAGAKVTSTGARMAVHYSSETPEWSTPDDLYQKLHDEFAFDLDVCATRENAKCPLYYTEQDDGLAQPWNGTCWMNPPYGDAIGKWVTKARTSSTGTTTVVCLLPARVDTGWWWENCIQGEIRFLRGRLRFGGGTTGAPFPSAIVIFNRKPRVVWWEWKT